MALWREELEAFEFPTGICGNSVQCPKVKPPGSEIQALFLSLPFVEPEVGQIPFFAAVPEVRLWWTVVVGRPLEICPPHAWLSACQGKQALALGPPGLLHKQMEGQVTALLIKSIIHNASKGKQKRFAMTQPVCD